MEKVIAIFSNPQECGTDTLDFVSLANGQIIKTITMEGFRARDAMEIVYHSELISEIATFYDYCRVQRWKIHEKERNLLQSLLYNEDGNRITGKDIPVINQYPASTVWTILDCEDTGKSQVLDFNDESITAKLWKYKVAVRNVTEELVYRPENDKFLKSFQEETGLIWPLEDRRALFFNNNAIADYIASKLNYKVVNTLSY